jgi:hypothetical protein
VLEVKNHCPFFVRSWIGGTRRDGKEPAADAPRFSIQKMAFDKSGVLPHYVPQLMMEMLCVGPECKSAVMVRQTANNGALVIRIQRDNGWIDEMLYWLNRFYGDFVEKEEPPPINFFWEGGASDKPRYKKFINWTKELESNVKILAHIPNTDVQRAMGTSPSTTSLFLD